MGDHRSYRVLCLQSARQASAGLWDVESIVLKTDPGWSGSTLKVRNVTASGSASDPEHGGYEGYAPANAFLTNGDVWGGRPDKKRHMWVGADVLGLAPGAPHPHMTQLRCSGHGASRVALQHRAEGGEWATVRVYSIGEEDGRLQEVAIEADDMGPPSRRWLVAPSRPCDIESAPDVCIAHELHPPRAHPFIPDPAFYHAIDCEGLWVCGSKKVEREVVEEAARWIRKWVPLSLRAKFAAFRSPKWAKDPGPMRVIILDNRTNEQAGCIPELQDESPGRNGTACPFVFTCRKDFKGGLGWPLGSLTCHELTHGADMVIRQTVDPYFHWEVGEVYASAMARKTYEYHDAKGKLHKTYATADQHEYLAECMVLFHNKTREDYSAAGIRNRLDLREKDPGVYSLIEKYFTEGGEEGKAWQLSTWRVLMLTSQDKGRPFCWDVERLVLLDDKGEEATPLKVFSSGSAQDEKHGGYAGYDAQYAFTPECIWGGRADSAGQLWIGVTVEGGLSGIGSIKQGKGHGATKVALQRREGEEGEWATACVYDVDDRGGLHVVGVTEG